MRASNDCIECCCLIPTFCISILVLVFGSLLIAQVTDPANEFFVNDIYAAPGHRYADIWADSEQCFVILHPKSFRGARSMTSARSWPRSASSTPGCTSVSAPAT